MAAARQAARTADVVELRADAVQRGGLERLLGSTGGPTIVTLRPRSQGGAYEGTEGDRVAFLERVLRESPHWIDVEWDVAPESRARLLGGGRAIVSYHDFEGTPEDLPGLLGRLRKIAGEAPVKLVTLARSLEDALRVRDLLRERRGPTIAFAMGSAGVVSRVCGPSWGSLLTYAAAHPAQRTAPGQPTVGELVDLYRVRSVTSRTRLYGVAGADVSRSLSPLLHNTLMAGLGIDGVYLPLPGAEFATLLAAARSLGVRGLSVTAPFKQAALASAASRSALAGRAGAANTLVRGPRGWRAENTDVHGLLRALEGRGFRARDAVAVVVGTGGAARGAALGLAEAGARVIVLGRDAGRGREVAAIAGGRFVALGSRGAAEVAGELWIDATSAAGSPLPARAFRTSPPGALAFDHSYLASVTPFLEAARRGGLAVENGLGMLYHQGLEQARLFHGREVPRDLARRAWRAMARHAALAQAGGTHGAGAGKPFRTAARGAPG